MSFGRNSPAIGADIADEKLKRTASVTASLNNRKSTANHMAGGDAISRRTRSVRSSEVQAPITKRNCQAKGLKYHVPSG